MSSLLEAIQGIFAPAPTKPKWNAALCNVNLRLALSRLRLQSTKKQALLKSQRKEIAKLLDEGKEVTARALTEQLIRDEKMIQAHAQLDIFCEQLLARLDAISRESAMPKDLVVCLCSLVFASARVDVEELKKVAVNLELRFGTLWADSCHSNLHGQVHEKIFGNLGIGRSSPAIVDEKMVTIAKEHDIDWSPLVPTPTEQDLAATYHAAQSLHGSHNSHPNTYQTMPKPSAPPSIAFETLHSTGIKPNLTNPTLQHVVPHRNSQGLSGGPTNAFSSKRASFELPIESSSPPIEYHHFSGAHGSFSDEELIMIEMLPQVPSNLAISMDLAPIAIEGGVIVTHEHDDEDVSSGFADLSQESLDVTEEDLYDEILTWEDIPDGPCFSSPQPSQSSSLDTFLPESEPINKSKASDEQEVDPLLERFKRLKGY